MEPITLTATAIATIIFSKALETSGENLGGAVSYPPSARQNVAKSNSR